MNEKELKKLRKQTKPRERPRSTVFDDGINRMEKRQQRRLTEKKIIEEELEIANDLILNEDAEIGLEEHYLYDEDY